LIFCGVVGLGTLVNRGKLEYLKKLRKFSSDDRWRIREAVAIALQRIGDVNMGFLVREMKEWSTGNHLEKRAAIAALCEPRLLNSDKVAIPVLSILDEVTSSFVKSEDRRSEAFEVLRKALAYCWSIAVAACPQEGKRLIEKWIGSKDKDVMWVLRENLKKKRLLRMDKEWVSSQLARLNSQT
jgi:hypothetical protein